MTSLKDLKNLARERGLRRYHNLKKEDLARLLNIPISPKPLKKDLKNLARERGLRRFHNLKKEDLARLLENQIPTNILDQQNPEINIPVLQPKKVKVKKDKIPSFIENTVETFSGWLNWLAESGKKYIPKPTTSKLKNLKEKINEIFESKKFEVKTGVSALQNFVREFVIEGQNGYDPPKFFETVKNLILDIFRENKNTKVKLTLNCQMQRTDLNTGKIIQADAEFHSGIKTNVEETDEKELLNEMTARINENMANFQRGGSNWVFVKINRLEIHMADWRPIFGSSYISLPEQIKKKKAVINIKNEDEQCFKWCVTRALNPVDEHPERITKDLKRQSERLNWDRLKFPVELKEIKNFEKNNPGISINVFGYEGNIYPLRIPKTKKRISIDLLLISDEEKQHYCIIKNLSRLISNN